MSDVAKWGLLVAAIIVVIGLVVALPFNQYIDSGTFSSAIATVLTIAGDGFVFGRQYIHYVTHSVIT